MLGPCAHECFFMFVCGKDRFAICKDMRVREELFVVHIKAIIVHKNRHCLHKFDIRERKSVRKAYGMTSAARRIGSKGRSKKAAQAACCHNDRVRMNIDKALVQFVEKYSTSRKTGSSILVLSQTIPVHLTSVHDIVVIPYVFGECALVFFANVHKLKSGKLYNIELVKAPLKCVLVAFVLDTIPRALFVIKAGDKARVSFMLRLD